MNRPREPPLSMARAWWLRWVMATRGDAAIIRPQERRDDDAVSLILRTNYPQLPHQTGIPFIYTGNSVENKRMLAINRSLGYEPLPRTVEIVKEL